MLRARPRDPTASVAAAFSDPIRLVSVQLRIDKFHSTKEELGKIVDDGAGGPLMMFYKEPGVNWMYAVLLCVCLFV